jgi:hypothetical protein
MLVAYLRAPSSDLGYVPLSVPSPITLPDGQRLEIFTPLAGVPKLRPVYTTLLEGGDVVVLKLGCSRDVEREVTKILRGHLFVFVAACELEAVHAALPIPCAQVSFLSQFIGKAGLPQLLASGVMGQEIAQGVSNYLVISPMGQLLGEDTDTELVRIVFRDIARTIKALHDLGILHRWVQHLVPASQQPITL